VAEPATPPGASGTSEASAPPVSSGAPGPSVSSGSSGSSVPSGPPAQVTTEPGATPAAVVSPSASGSLPAALLQYRVAGKTDVGLLRESNEDSILIGDLDRARVIDLDGGVLSTMSGARGPLLLVCDGMGGVEPAARSRPSWRPQVTWRELSVVAGSSDPEVFARLLRRAVRIANADDPSASAKRDAGLQAAWAPRCPRRRSAAIAAGGRHRRRLAGVRAALRRPAGAGERAISRWHSALLAAGHDGTTCSNASGAILQALGVGDDCRSLALGDRAAPRRPRALVQRRALQPARRVIGDRARCSRRRSARSLRRGASCWSRRRAPRAAATTSRRWCCEVRRRPLRSPRIGRSAEASASSIRSARAIRR
jgi:hypothetical protein